MAPRMDMIGLVVSDLAASLAFYRKLGLDIPEGAEGEPHVETTLPGGIRMAWDTIATIESFHGSYTPPTGSPRVALAFLCDDAADVDAQFRALVDAGAEVSKEPWDAFWGQRYAIVLDPDGNSVDLFAPLG